MPVESGEKRREVAANSHEEDRGGDNLEWCLREYEKRMNNSTTNNETTTEIAEIEEHKANTGEGNQSNVELRPYDRGESDLQQDEEELEGGRDAVRDFLQRLEPLHHECESNPHTETTSTEREHNSVTNKTEQETANNNAPFGEECDYNFAEQRRDNPSEAHVREYSRSTDLTDNQSESTTNSIDHDTEQQWTLSTELNNLDGVSNETSTVRNDEQIAVRGRGEKESISSETDSEHFHFRKAMDERADVVDLNTSTVHDARVIGAGEFVRECRMDLDLRQYELADKLGCDRRWISCWEINERSILLEDLREISVMAGRDLERALRELQSGNLGVSIEWKGKIYDVETFRESIQDPHAKLNYSELHPTYYLELGPMADVEFHRKDKITTLLEKDGVQGIAEFTVVKGTRVNIMKAVVERMGIERGDELRVRVLNVRGPEDPPWIARKPIELSMGDGKTKIQLNEKFEELGFEVRDGDYARMVIQTGGGEALVAGTIKDKAIILNESIVKELLATGDKEASSLIVKMDSIVISPKPFREGATLPIEQGRVVQIRGLLSTEGFTLPERGATLTADVVTDRNEGGENTERLTMRIGISGTIARIFPPYSATEDGTRLQLKLENMVILNPKESETSDSRTIVTTHGETSYEKSMMSRELFDALIQHMGADTLYQVENPSQGGIDRVIEKDGRIIIVEEKAEHQHGVAWRTTTTINQILGYRNRFQELTEKNPNLQEKLRGREPDGLEIWTTAKVPKDQNGEIDSSKVQLYNPKLRRNLKEGEAAMFTIQCMEPDGERLRRVPGVEYSVSVSEKNEVMFSMPIRKLALSDGREIIVPCDSSLASDRLQIRVKHHDHIIEACKDSSLFGVKTQEDLRRKLLRIEQRLS